VYILCLCMSVLCVCVYIYIYTHTYACIHTHTRTVYCNQHIYIYTCVFMYIYMYCMYVGMYEAYSESKYHFAVKKSSKVSYKILLSDSTFFKLFFHIFAAIIEVLIVAGHKFSYTPLIECGRVRC